MHTERFHLFTAAVQLPFSLENTRPSSDERGVEKTKKKREWIDDTMLLKHHYNHKYAPGSCFTVTNAEQEDADPFASVVFSPCLLFFSLIGWLSGMRGCNLPRELKTPLLPYLVSRRRQANCAPPQSKWSPCLRHKHSSISSMCGGSLQDKKKKLQAE